MIKLHVKETVEAMMNQQQRTREFSKFQMPHSLALALPVCTAH